MRCLINYLRQVFCVHYWHRDEREMIRPMMYDTRQSVRVSATCQKCGYHTSYWKF